MVVGELTQERDLLIIGGGPAGYTAAIRAAQGGRNVTLIEQAELGGLCLNRGCIPSKVYAHAAEEMLRLPHLEDLGFTAPAVHDFSKLNAYRNRVVQQLRQGVVALCQANQIEHISGAASFLSEDRIGVESGHQFDTYRFQDVIIATGSHSIQHEESCRLNAEQLYQLEQLPESLLIIGSDTLALEAAACFHALGTEVTLFADRLSLEPSLEKELKRTFKKQKIRLVSDVVTRIEASSDATVTVMKNGEEVAYQGAYLFQSLSRIPNSLTLGLERIGVTLAEDGTIPVDVNGRTNQPHIYAIGDVTPGPQLAIRAIHEAKRTAAHLSGQDVDSTTPYYPTVLRTFPPIASVGMTEQEAVEAGHAVQSGQFPLNANGATTIEGGSGFVKVIADEQTSLILGIHMIGDDAHRLVGQFTQALELTAKREDLLFPVMAHPSRSEAVTESMEAYLVNQSIFHRGNKSVRARNPKEVPLRQKHLF